MDYVNKNSIITWGNVFVVDHNLAISVGTTELVEEAQQVHDELHNIGLGGITVQMDVLDTSKTARQAVSRATVNKREMIIINTTVKHWIASNLVISKNHPNLFYPFTFCFTTSVLRHV